MASASPYFIGDSIAQGLQSAAGGSGDTKVGRSPAQVLQAISNGPDLTGRSVVLSSGLSNNPGDMASVQAQIAALKAKGAANISVVGLGSRFNNLNPALGNIAAQNGATFTGGFQAGADGVHPANYGSTLHSVSGAGAGMTNTSYPPSNAAATMPGAAYPPPNVQPAPVYPPSPLGSLPALTAAIEHHESGGNPNAVSPVGARGSMQIMPATFRQHALPGENINNPADNRAVGQRILAGYLKQYNGDAARAAVAYFSGPGNVAPPGSPTPWISNRGDGNNTVAQYVANTAGKMGGYKGAPPASTPSSTPTAAPPPKPTVGSLLAGLTAPTGSDGKGPSQIEQAGQAAGGGGQQSQSAAPEPDLQGQQAAAMGGQARQQQLAAQAQQSAAAMGARSSQPLTWGSAPPGSGYGPQTPPMTMGYWGGASIPMPARVVAPGAGAGQQIPGTTLNSIGAV